MAGISEKHHSTSGFRRDTSCGKLPNHKMAIRNLLRFTVGLVCVVGVVLSLAGMAEANYKNAPMNGIMFGKRVPSDYDNRGRALTALCEIANEACQTWFPPQENK